MGVRTDDFGFNLIDLKKLTYKNKSFIMVEQAKQIFYVQDPCDERWSMVLPRKTIALNIEDDDSTHDSCLTYFSTQISANVNGEEVDDVLANHNDHDERELINIV